MYSFSGGQFFNAYKVLNQKVRGVDKNLDKIQAYIHQGSTIVYVSSTKSDAMGAFYRVYANNPLLLTEVDTDKHFEDLPEETKVTLQIKSENSEPIQLHLNLHKKITAKQFIAPFDSKAPYISMLDAKIYINTAVQYGGSVWSVEKKVPSKDGIQIRGYLDSQPLLFLDLEYLGSYEKLEKFTVLSTADEYNQVSPGYIKIVSNEDATKSLRYYNVKSISYLVSA